MTFRILDSGKPAWLCAILAVAIVASTTLSPATAFSPPPPAGAGGSSTTTLRASSSSPSSSSSSSTEANPTDTREEAVVRRYFDGVNRKDPVQLRSCFAETATLRDVCGLDATEKTVPADLLVDRCMEFVTAHPDCLVRFHYGPCAQRERADDNGSGSGSNDDGDDDGTWVVAHWYEIGNWSGDSCGIPAPDPPLAMAVEGQTRFRVVEIGGSPRIERFVVTRTFTDWENAMVAARADAAAAATTAQSGAWQRNARQGRRFDLVGLDWIGLDSNPHGLNQLVALASRCSWIVSGVESTNGLGLELGWLARSLARSVSFFGKEPVSIDMIEPDSVCPTSVRRIESNRGEAKRDDSVVPPCRGEECGSDQMEERTSADYYYGSRLLHRYCVANTTP
eukprot:CAMPEP_0172360220 /NCGR_PEP_ID=MMETSP1060-20121228/4295_1 /TAXON_ID=37318 /ORGANISM="Pseudo-nitzschia pungens, Strain cf. cingulata" /LENGTH=393 /DNA_ID=CAMNT_0013082161 /DNA_START=47 /DNA_END=1229 /DNA_ORIENTATION=+